MKGVVIKIEDEKLVFQNGLPVLSIENASLTIHNDFWGSGKSYLNANSTFGQIIESMVEAYNAAHTWEYAVIESIRTFNP